MVAEGTLIAQLLSAMGLGTAAASKMSSKDLADAIGEKIQEGWYPGAGAVETVKKVKKAIQGKELEKAAEKYPTAEIKVRRPKDVSDKEWERYQKWAKENKFELDPRGPDDEDPKKKLAKAAASGYTLNKTGDLALKTEVSGTGKGTLEGKELAKAQKDSAARARQKAIDDARAKGKSIEIEITDDQIMGKPKDPSKISSQGAIDATRKHPVPMTDDRVLASEQQSFLTSKRADATAKNPIIQKTDDILNDRTRQDMTNTYPTEDPFEGLSKSDIKEEEAPKFDFKLPAIAVATILTKVLGADEAEAEEYAERYQEIGDALKNINSIEDYKIATQMAKDFEKEVGSKAMNAISVKIKGKDKEEK